jgi:hypothetical protein
MKTSKKNTNKKSSSNRMPFKKGDVVKYNGRNEERKGKTFVVKRPYVYNGDLCCVLASKDNKVQFQVFASTLVKK